LAALAALVALAVPASSPARKKLDRDTVSKLLRVELRKRGLEVTNVSRCRPKNAKFTVFHCRWRAEGRAAGDVPYSCAGFANYSTKKRDWQIQPCDNKLAPRIPLLPELRPHPQWFGYNEVWHEYGPGTLDMLTEGGGTTARQGLYWTAVERSPNHYTWDEFDALYRRMTDRGIRPLFVLTRAPCWAQQNPAACRHEDTNIHPTRSHYDDFADFAAAAAQRYPLALGFEIWNEPNDRRYWGGKPSPVDYASMFKQARSAIKQVNPTMPVVLAGLSPHASDTAGASVAYDGYLKRLYELGAAKKADAIGLHPYPTVAFNDGYIDAIRTRLGRINQTMEHFNDGDRPMWVTESGVSTEGPEAYTENQQATALVDIYQLFRRVPNIPVVIFHRFIDSPDQPGAKEPGFGVITTSGRAKRAYCALAHLRGFHPNC
jgi:hypothetical protein